MHTAPEFAYAFLYSVDCVRYQLEAAMSFTIVVSVPRGAVARADGAADGALKSWVVATIVSGGRPSAAFWWTDDVARTRSKPAEGGAPEYDLSVSSRPVELNDDVLSALANAHLVVRVHRGDGANPAGDPAIGSVTLPLAELITAEEATGEWPLVRAPGDAGAAYAGSRLTLAVTADASFGEYVRGARVLRLAGGATVRGVPPAWLPLGAAAGPGAPAPPREALEALARDVEKNGAVYSLCLPLPVAGHRRGGAGAGGGTEALAVLARGGLLVYTPPPPAAAGTESKEGKADEAVVRARGRA